MPASASPNATLAETIAGDLGAYLGTASPWVTVTPSKSGPNMVLSVAALFPANAPAGSPADAGSLEV